MIVPFAVTNEVHPVMPAEKSPLVSNEAACAGIIIAEKRTTTEWSAFATVWLTSADEDLSMSR